MKYMSELLSAKPPLKCKYKKRYPDPGVCTVISIDWERRKLSVTNGAVRLFPDFTDVTLFSED